MLYLIIYLTTLYSIDIGKVETFNNCYLIAVELEKEAGFEYHNSYHTIYLIVESGNSLDLIDSLQYGIIGNSKLATFYNIIPPVLSLRDKFAFHMREYGRLYKCKGKRMVTSYELNNPMDNYDKVYNAKATIYKVKSVSILPLLTKLVYRVNNGKEIIFDKIGLITCLEMDRFVGTIVFPALTFEEYKLRRMNGISR